LEKEGERLGVDVLELLKKKTIKCECQDFPQEGSLFPQVTRTISAL